jgi:hypothetical protein
MQCHHALAVAAATSNNPKSSKMHILGAPDLVRKVRPRTSALPQSFRESSEIRERKLSSIFAKGIYERSGIPACR